MDYRIQPCLFVASILTAIPISAQSYRVDGDFSYSHVLDDFTDEDRSFIWVLSEDEEGSLWWACTEGGPRVVVSTGYMIGDNTNRVQLMYRIDRKEPSSNFLAFLGTDKRTAFFPRRPHMRLFNEAAKAGTRVVIRATDPFDGGQNTFRFSLIGLTSSLELLPCYQG